MEGNSKSVVVKRMPERMSLKEAREFLKEVQPCLSSDRPQLVFDLSQVRRIDTAGMDVLLHCMREVMKRDGDLKLAAPSPQAAIVLELTRTGRLFEIHENTAKAVKSFSSYLPETMTNSGVHGGEDGALWFAPSAPRQAEEDSEGGWVAA